LTGGLQSSSGAVAQSESRNQGQSQAGRRGGGASGGNVPVEVATAAKKTIPVRGESLGTVTPMANVAIKSRVDTEIVEVHFSGRASMAAVKAGNFVRSADQTPLATIIQSAPVYVTFTLPQRNLADLRAALAAGSANIDAVVPGDSRHATGQVTMIENTVDPVT